MKNVAIINTCIDGSTGKIANGLNAYLNGLGYTSYLCYGRGEKQNTSHTYRIDFPYEVCFHALMCRVTGMQGVYSISATQRLIKFLNLKEIDTIFGVGLHGYYLNEPMFFEYVKEKNMKFIYVLVDEYAYLGKCGYSDGCMNYLTGCGNCPRIKEYPKSIFFDRTHEIYAYKEKAYSGLERMICVGPEYTITAAKQSPLLRDKKMSIVDEAIDVDFYKPRKINALRDELGISDEKIVILCVAPFSYERKGVRYFVELACRFENDKRFVFVHVGYDIKKRDNLPKNYIAMGYEKDQNRLAEYYSLGDLFVFPSLLDTMPNACLEALSCGTPLLCFDISGMSYIGPQEIVTLVEAKNVDAMAEIVKKTGKKTEEISSKCREYAIMRYNNKDYFKKLLSAAQEIL